MSLPNETQESQESQESQQAPGGLTVHLPHSVHKARWAALVGALAIGLLYAALPPSIRIGPSWLPLALVVILALPFVATTLTRRTLHHVAARIIAFALLGVVTAALATGVTMLIVTLPTNKHPIVLLQAATLLWCSNILVFALWYWEIDGGGPVKRHLSGHKAADFMFPQQVDGNKSKWVPLFPDYLFLAFTGATALSPADTYPLTRPAKMLMMIEALISMAIVVLLASRAVNILSG